MTNSIHLTTRLLALLLALLTLLFALVSCGGSGDDPAITATAADPEPFDPEAVGTNIKTSAALASGAPGLFWNNMDYKSGPYVGDPFILYDEGVFYLYGTTRRYVDPTKIVEGFEVYYSTDLINWKDGGAAFTPGKGDWCTDRLWAPEVYKIGDKYYMYYTGASGSYGVLHGSVAVADSPLGPFSNKVADGVNPRKPVFDFGSDFPTIDGTLFTDDDGSLYYFFVRDQIGDSASIGKDKSVRSTLWGIELENPYTIKEGASPVKLTEVGRSTVGEKGSFTQKWERTQGLWNEGPFALKHDGKYYLTYSANAFTSKYYAIGYAVSDSPLGTYVKGSDAEIMGIDPTESSDRAYFAGTGHAMFLYIGSELFVVYHTLIPNTDTLRHFTIDRAGFRPDGSLYINGPTLSAQPLPAEISGLENVALGAPAFAKDAAGAETEIEGAEKLTDGEFDALSATAGNAAKLPAGETSIVVDLGGVKDVSAVVVYNSADYDLSFTSVSNITVGKYYSFDDVKVLEDSIDAKTKLIKAGSCAVLIFNKPVKASSVTVTFNTDKPLAVSEIAVYRALPVR